MFYIIGDSTAATKSPEQKPQSGWGEYLYLFLGVKKEAVVNLAVNGRSTKSFLAENRFTELLRVLQPDDTVFIQFGHNDEKVRDPARYTDPFGVFSEKLIYFVTQIRSKNATPILLTPQARRNFKENILVDTHGDYLKAVYQTAKKTNVTLLDANQFSMNLLRQMGPQNSVVLFNHLAYGESPNYPEGVGDNTHFSILGAHLFAEGIARMYVDYKNANKSGD